MKHLTPIFLSTLLIIFISSCSKTDAGDLPNEPGNSNNSSPISHGKFTNVLSQFVNANGDVNYAGLKQNQTEFKEYLTQLKENPPQSSWTAEQKITFWINVYNAFTLKLIIDNYPVNSILDINGGQPWDHSFVTIGNAVYTLNYIEHTILRGQFNEPRIHFAVNCASISCPVLLNVAYEDGSLNAQLTQQSRRFINDPTKNILSGDPIQISEIFNWYSTDFTQQTGNIIDYINQYANSNVAQNANITYLPYNWGLNEQ